MPRLEGSAMNTGTWVIRSFWVRHCDRQNAHTDGCFLRQPFNDTCEACPRKGQ